MKLNIQLFSSTNKTTNLELSQYIGTDKPTYLGDYNSDMLKIDTASGQLGTAIQGVASGLQTTDSNIGTLSSLTTTNKTNLVNAINEVDSNTDTNATNIGSLENLQTTNKSTLVNAINEVLGDLSKFNLSNVTNFTAGDLIVTNGTWSGGSIKVATDTTNSIFKMYGFLIITGTSSDQTTVKFNTSLRPSEDYVINAIGVQFNYNSGAMDWHRLDAYVSTNGDISIPINVNNGELKTIQVFPCLYFNSSFGDTPSQ